MGEDSDRLLIQECLAGEQRAFAMLVGKYGRVVFNVAYRMSRAPNGSCTTSSNRQLQSWLLTTGWS
jgi:hypothetical protein